MTAASTQVAARPKMLAMIFMYLGDVVVTTPALRALRRAYPDWELHVLVPQEAAPLLSHVPWLDRVWAFPRKRGRFNIAGALPSIRQLRRERFDVSIDFVGNDRSALLSMMIGAKRRIGAVSPRGFLLRSRCYTDAVEPLDATRHASVRAWSVTTPLCVPFPEDMTPEVAVDPQCVEAARGALGNARVLCYVTTSQPKREWSPENWIELARLISATSTTVAFTGGSSAREKRILDEIARRNTGIAVVPAPEPLERLLAVIAGAGIFITGDTGPLHFAAGLRVPTLSLFGPTAATCWAPIGQKDRWLQGGLCPCSGHDSVCSAQRPCINQITPAQVFESYVGMTRKAGG